MERNLVNDRQIDKFDLPLENARQADIYGHWSDKYATAKDIKQRKKLSLERLKAKKRMEYVKNLKNQSNSEPTENELKYFKLVTQKENLENSLKRNKSNAMINAFTIPMVTATGKEKDPTTKDLENKINIDPDVQKAEDEMAELMIELRPLEHSISTKKEPTAKDIDSAIENDDEIIALEMDLLEVMSDENLYKSAVDSLEVKKASLNNLTSLWIKQMYADPKGERPAKENRNNQRSRLKESLNEEKI